MRKHKRLIFILIIILIFGTFAIGVNLIVRKGNTELPTSSDISTVNVKEPTIVPTTKPTSPGNLEINDIDSSSDSKSWDSQTKATNNDQWKQAYIDYVQNTLSTDSWDGYELINLDNDDIPELVALGCCEAQGNLVCNYYDGTVNSTPLQRSEFYYIEKENLLCNSEGLMDHYYDIVYSLINGKLTQIVAGYWGELDNSGHHFDKDGKLIYQYSWDGVTVTEDEYNQCLNSIFDMSRATGGNTNQPYSADEIINMIKGY